MPSYARNESQLRSMLMPRIQQAVDYVTNKIYEENKQVVQEVVYNAYSPTVYNRTGELKESWKTESSMTSSNTVRGEFTYDSSKLSVGSTIQGSSNYGQHISIVNDSVIVNELAQIVYQGISTATFGPGPWTKERDAWDKLVKQVGNRKISNWMKEGLQAAGLTVVRHTAGIGNF